MYAEAIAQRRIFGSEKMVIKLGLVLVALTVFSGQVMPVAQFDYTGGGILKGIVQENVMLKDLAKEIKKILKENYKFFIAFFIVLFLFTFKLPFYISKTGGVIDLEKRIKTKNNYKYNGKLYMSYVTNINGTIPNLIFAMLNKNWDIESSKKEDGNGTAAETLFRNRTALLESIDNAKITAYKYADKVVEIKKQNIYVTYIYEEANTDLKVGDIIKKINNKDIISKKDISSYLNTLKVGDEVKITVIRDKKKIKKYAKVIEINKKKILGIMCHTNYELKTNPEIKIDFKSDESGPSGGLMLTLAIYSKLNELDITKGRKVAGTGTIDEEGNVGEISGVKYKLAGAVKNRVEIFLVPNGKNYEEAINELEKNNYDIRIYGVNTFEEALDVLSK